MKASIFRIWFDVGPSGSTVPKGLKCAGLTMRKSSPFYKEAIWVNADGSEKLMTAYTGLPDNFESEMSKETGLDIAEYDTAYILQVFVNFDKPPSAERLRVVHQKLECFVRKHFKSFVPNTKAQ